MRIAITGAKGQLATDLLSTDSGAVETLPLSHPDLDITDRERVHTILGDIKPDVIINTAAFHKTDLCEDEVGQSFNVNSAGVKYLAEYAESNKAILIHISTDYVFDGKKKSLKEPYTENDTPNPLNIYGISKYAGEIIIQNYMERFYILRVASLYGKTGASGKGGNFVYTILKKAKEKGKLGVINDIFMSPTFTKDIAIKIWEIIKKRDEYPFGIYHVTNQGIASWYDFAKVIVELAGIDCEVTPISHTQFPTKVNTPLWSPLTSIKGTNLRPWREAIEEFIRSGDRNKDV